MCFNNLFFAEWEELIECALPEDVWLKNKCVDALNHLDIKMCDQVVSEQDCSGPGGIVTIISLLDYFTKCCTKESVSGHFGAISVGII